MSDVCEAFGCGLCISWFSNNQYNPCILWFLKFRVLSCYSWFLIITSPAFYGFSVHSPRCSDTAAPAPWPASDSARPPALYNTHPPRCSPRRTAAPARTRSAAPRRTDTPSPPPSKSRGPAHGIPTVQIFTPFFLSCSRICSSQITSWKS